MVERPSVSREERRRLLRENKLIRELLNIIYSYFPDLINQLKHVNGPRRKKSTKYDIGVFLLERIFSAIFSIDSMRNMTENFNDEAVIQNIAKILQANLSELPSHDTMNNCFKKLDITQLEEIIYKMIQNLIRRNTFNNNRIRGKYWQILIDATEIGSFISPHCEHCLFRRHKNRKGEVTSIDYYHCVLEAKLVLHENLVFSICTVFIENEDPIPSQETLWDPKFDEPGQEKKKQDCELKAFYRLAPKLKKAFPRLPICITADSLYPCKEVFEICQNYGWHFIMRFKEGSISTLWKKYITESLKHYEEQSLHKFTGRSKVNYCYVNNLTYSGFSLNVVECDDSSVEYAFVFLTDLPLSSTNCEVTAEDGRRRWRIENEGFNQQKNHGYNLKHTFCEDYNAMKVHYFLIQIAHAIGQLFDNACKILKQIPISLKKLHENLKNCFKNSLLTDGDLTVATQKSRFCLRDA